MSALTMILTVAIAVPGDGPEKESMEMVQTLDLSGEWEGTGKSANSKAKLRISRGHGQIDLESAQGRVGANLKIIDEGEGKLRMELGILGTARRLLGIYQYQGDRLFICCREESQGRPTRFKADEVNCLFNLHRKP